MDEEAIEEGDDNSLDLYADILEPEDVNNAVEVTSEECEKLKEELQVAVSSNKTLQLQCEILRKNISVLYLTAKNEIQRKKDQLADLQRRYDTLIFRRGKRDVAPKHPIISSEREENNSRQTASVETGKFTSALAVKKSSEENSVRGDNIEDADAMKLAAMHGLRKKTVKKTTNNEISSVARHQRAEDSPPNPIEGSNDKTCVGKELDRNLPNNSKCDTKPSRRNNDTVRKEEGNSDSDKNARKRKTDDNNSHGSSKRPRQSNEKATNRREFSPLRSSAGHGKLERWNGARTSSGSSGSSDRRRRSRSRSQDRGMRRSHRMPNDRLR